MGGSEEGPKPGYVIYEWSLSKCRSTTMVHDRTFSWYFWLNEETNNSELWQAWIFRSMNCRVSWLTLTYFQTCQIFHMGTEGIVLQSSVDHKPSKYDLNNAGLPNFLNYFPRKLTFLKFIYSEKATKFCEIFPLLLTTVHTVKSKGKILQNFVAFSEYMNFNLLIIIFPCYRVIHGKVS